MNRSSSSAHVENPDWLPTWDPQSLAGKRQLRRERLYEKAVHVIPVVIATCLAVLWIFSLPPESANEVNAMPHMI